MRKAEVDRHPASPDPVTIRSDADWDRCATFAELQQRAATASPAS